MVFDGKIKEDFFFPGFCSLSFFVHMFFKRIHDGLHTIVSPIHDTRKAKQEEKEEETYKASHPYRTQSLSTSALHHCHQQNYSKAQNGVSLAKPCCGLAARRDRVRSYSSKCQDSMSGKD